MAQRKNKVNGAALTEAQGQGSNLTGSMIESDVKRCRQGEQQQEDLSLSSGLDKNGVAFTASADLHSVDEANGDVLKEGNVSSLGSSVQGKKRGRKRKEEKGLIIEKNNNNLADGNGILNFRDVNGKLEVVLAQKGGNSKGFASSVEVKKRGRTKNGEKRLRKENGGVAFGAEDGSGKLSDKNGKLEVGLAQEGEIMEEQRKREGENGLKVHVFVHEGFKDFGDWNGKLILGSALEGEGKVVGSKPKKKRGRPRKSRNVEGNIEVMEENSTKKRGRPRKNNNVGGNIEVMEENRTKKRGRPRKSRNVEGNIEVMEKNPKKKRGRPRKSRKVEGKMEVKEENPKKKRGRPRKSGKAEGNIELIEIKGKEDVNNDSMGSAELVGEEQAKGLDFECLKEEEAMQETGDGEIEAKELGKEGNVEEMENLEKKRGRSRFHRDENGNIEVMENNREEYVNESVGTGELVREEEAKGLHLECGKEEEAVKENGVAEKEGKGLGEESDRRNDQGAEGNGGFDGRSLRQRESKMEAELKMVISNAYGEWGEEEKRTRKRRDLSQGNEKEDEGEENGGESEVNKGGGDGGNRKRKRGKKSFKGVERKEENGGRAGELIGKKEKEQDRGEKKKRGKWQQTGKGEEGEGEGEEKTEEGQKMSKYAFRARKQNRREAFEPKKLLKDENGHLVSNMCHQCQRNDKGRVVRCNMCKTRRYCITCLIRWYDKTN